MLELCVFKVFMPFKKGLKPVRKLLVSDTVKRLEATRKGVKIKNE